MEWLIIEYIIILVKSVLLLLKPLYNGILGKSKQNLKFMFDNYFQKLF